MIKPLLPVIFSLLFFVGFGQNHDGADKDTFLIKVTLLGTGSPVISMERFGPSILVQAGKEILLFDAGRGCIQRLNQLGIIYKNINAFFITHLHSDHVVGIPDLWLTGWLTSRRDMPLKTFGPAGTVAMTDNLEKAFAYDIKIRVEDGKLPREGSRLDASDIQQGVVYEHNDVRVIAFLVDHYPVIPAFGYRIEYKGHSVVLSGDTRYSENLIQFSKGADLLVHEVVLAPDTLSKTDPKYSIFAHHTTIEQAAKIFSVVKPKLSVYSHIVSLYGINEKDLYTRTEANYKGPFVIGEDLMSFSITDSVSIHPWKGKRN